MAVARIAGITLPNKRVEIALTYIYGIGKAAAGKILDELKVNKNTRTNDLTVAEVNAIREVVEKNRKVEGELRRDVQANVRRLKEIGAFRGVRHMRGLPVRGQRTKTNSRTVRGNVRKTATSGRTKVEKK